MTLSLQDKLIVEAAKARTRIMPNPVVIHRTVVQKVMPKEELVPRNHCALCGAMTTQYLCKAHRGLL
jgi:hypothetical protein